MRRPTKPITFVHETVSANDCALKLEKTWFEAVFASSKKIFCNFIELPQNLLRTFSESSEKMIIGRFRNKNSFPSPEIESGINAECAEGIGNG